MNEAATTAVVVVGYLALFGIGYFLLRSARHRARTRRHKEVVAAVQRTGWTLEPDDAIHPGLLGCPPFDRKVIERSVENIATSSITYREMSAFDVVEKQYDEYGSNWVRYGALAVSLGREVEPVCVLPRKIVISVEDPEVRPHGVPLVPVSSPHPSFNVWSHGSPGADAVAAGVIAVLLEWPGTGLALDGRHLVLISLCARRLGGRHAVAHWVDRLDEARGILRDVSEQLHDQPWVSALPASTD